MTTQPSSPAEATNAGGKQFTGNAANAAPTGHPVIHAVVEAINDFIGGYQMNDVLTQDDFLNGLSELLRRCGEVCNDLADSWNTETPVDAEVADLLREFGESLTAMADSADEVYERWADAHEYDISRARDPRAGEEKLDVDPAGTSS